MIPKFRLFDFKRNDASTWYERGATLGNFKKVPPRLKVEETWQEHIRKNGASYTAHDGRKDGEHDFFTGLLPVPMAEGVFVGNQRTNGKQSLCIFRFSANLEAFSLWHFNNFYVSDRGSRFEFVRHFLSTH